MEQLKLGEMEQRFADLIWREEPVKSMELCRLCEQEFGWKKSTVFTMLKRLCERKIFINQRGLVTSLMSKEDFQSAKGQQFIQENYGGSLPQFLASFTRRNKLSEAEISEIQKLIDDYNPED